MIPADSAEFLQIRRVSPCRCVEEILILANTGAPRCSAGSFLGAMQ